MASYYVWSGAGGAANGTSWVNAYTTLATAFSGHAAGDIYYVAHDHVETAGPISLSSNGSVSNATKVICVNRAGSVPPVSADRRATATFTSTGSNPVNISGSTHYDGCIFTGGPSTGAAAVNLCASANTQWQRFDNCSMRMQAASTAGLNISTSSFGGACVEFNNTTVSFGAVGQTTSVFGVLKWRNTPSALIGAAVPTTLFTPPATRGTLVECIGVDLSAAGSGKTLVGSLATAQAQTYRFIDCKLNAAVTKAATPAALGTTDVDFIRAGATGVNYTVSSYRYTGALIEETTIVRSGGASDGTTPLSWKIVTTANCSYSMPFECPSVAIWNDTTGSPVTATVECIAAAIMTDGEIWLDVEYFGDASSPQASFVNDGKADLLATAVNQTSSSETWGGSTTAFKLAVTFTAQQAGWIYGRVKCAKASSTVYVDPLITLT